MDLNARTALVTGANRGIGREIVKALIEAGCSRVYAGARDPAKLDPLVEAHGDRVVPLRLDVTRSREINAAARQAKDATILVNNAGAAEFGALLDKDAVTSLKRQWEVNTLGPLRVTQAFAPKMIKSGGGCVVNLNTVGSFRSLPFAPTYCATKAASFSLTQGLRNELVPYGVHVISVFPGPIDTEMAEGLPMETTDPAVVGRAVVGAIRSEQAFLFPDPFALDYWHDFESRPGPFLAELLPTR